MNIQEWCHVKLQFVMKMPKDVSLCLSESSMFKSNLITFPYKRLIPYIKCQQ
jgi:hypothetical protein